MAKTMQDATLLAAALEGLELQKARIDEQIRAVKSMLGKGSPKVEAAKAEAPSAEAPAKKRKKRRLSPEARERIAAAQKKRWTEFRKKKKAAAGEQ